MRCLDLQILGVGFKILKNGPRVGVAMIIEPRIRNNICVNAHPQGCAAQVLAQVDYVGKCPAVPGPGRVLVVGATNGYGLAARIVSAFGSRAATIGLGYEKSPTERRTGSAGWYNAEAFLRLAEQSGRKAWNLNGDAFADGVKEETAAIIAKHLGQIDFLVYSIAAPRRIDPDSGAIHTSVIKPLDRPLTELTVDFLTGRVREITAEPATRQETEDTVKVMGGEDWKRWIESLSNRNLLAGGFCTLAFSYIGSRHTRRLYRDGTIGQAKKDLEKKALEIQSLLEPLSGKSRISVNKALITRASAVIPAVPLYIALLYRVMKEKGLHEGCIQQMYRMVQDRRSAGRPIHTDARGRIRMDDWEMRDDVQHEVSKRWEIIRREGIEDLNGSDLADIAGMRDEFLRHHGFGMPGVDYRRDADPEKIELP